MLRKISYKYVLLLLLNVLFQNNLKAETKEQTNKVLLRSVGHEFLLQLNDSTSRILAIEKIDNRFAVRFENEFSFEPDMLFFVTFKVFKENETSESFIVEVEKCDSNQVVHSFKASLKKIADKNLIACRQRTLPKGCYIFYFTEIKDSLSIVQENKKTNSSWTLNSIIFFLFIGVVLVFFVFLKKRNNQINPDLINIGQYLYDQKGMRLILKQQSVNLSSKEADLLLLLLNYENKTLEREYILTQVWGNDGNYVGRTLDVFISKLRKKLEADTNLKILNIRGVGYRFVINS